MNNNTFKKLFSGNQIKKFNNDKQIWIESTSTENRIDGDRLCGHPCIIYDEIQDMSDVQDINASTKIIEHSRYGLVK